MTGGYGQLLPANLPAYVCVLELNAPIDDLQLLSLFNISGRVAVETLVPVMVSNMKAYDMFPPTEENPVWARLVIAGPTTAVFATGHVSEVTRVFDSEPARGAIPSRILRTDMQNGDLIAMYSAEGVPFGFTDMETHYFIGRDQLMQMQGRQPQEDQDDEAFVNFVSVVKGMAFRIDLQAAEGGNLMQVDMDFRTLADADDWKTGMEKSISDSLMNMNFTVAQNKGQAATVPPEYAQAFENEMKVASFLVSTIEGLKVTASENRMQLAWKKTTGFDQTFAELLAPTYAQFRLAQQAGLDGDCLRLIAMGITCYLETSQSRFPHYAIFGEDGTPLLSWRVALLPALGETELYNQFHLNEPWNSEHNLTLIEKMPQVFTDPSGQTPAGKTIFRMFGGEGSVLAKFPNGFSWNDLTFPPETLYLLAVVPDQAVFWTQPEFVQYQPETFRPLVRPMFAAMFCTCEVITVPADNPNLVARLPYWVSGTISPETAEILRARQRVDQLRQQEILQQQMSPQNNLPQPPPVPPMGNQPMPMLPLGQ